MEHFYVSIFILCCSQTAITVLAKSRDHTGTRFVVALFRNLDLSKLDVFLIIAAVDNVNTTIDVTYKDNNEDRVSSHHLLPSLTEQISFQKEFGTIKMPFPVVRINSTHPISITTFVDSPKSAASYLAFPQEVAGVEYRMLPYCNTSDKGACVCVIVSLQRDTNVSIVNKNHGNISVYTAKHAVGENTIYQLSLPHSKLDVSIEDEFSHVSLESLDDFTGLLLLANQPVQVFCGGTKQEAMMSMEQIPPVQYFGRQFYTFPTAYKSMAPSNLRFISHYNCTTIEVSHLEISFILNAGQYREISTQKITSVFITSNKPIAIMHIFSGVKIEDRYNEYQEGILFLPSVNSYVSSVIIPRRKKTDESMTIMAMFVGLVTPVYFNFQTYTSNFNVNKIFRSNGIIQEKDDDGHIMRLSRDCSCENGRNGHSFGGYISRRNIIATKDSFSLIGYIFISTENETSQYRSESCGKKRDIVDKSTIAVETPIPKNAGLQSVDTSTQGGVTYTATDHMNLKTTSKSTPNFEEYQHLWMSGTNDGSTATVSKSETITVSTESIISQCPKCPCHQESTPKYTVKTEEDLDKRIREIKEELTIKKADLSAYRRMKTSADDGRISAKSIGFVGVIILCSVASFILIMDFPTLAHQTVVLWRNTFGRSVHAVRRCLRGDP